MSAELTPIGATHLEALADLLEERNGTIPAYTLWKYGKAGDGRFRGLIAVRDGQPVGCFGVVPRNLVLQDGSQIECGWFADWYVVPSARGEGIGEALLRELSAYLTLVFGHPQPVKARAICVANGYRPIGFHSWRRLLIRPWIHERPKTRYWMKAAIRALVGTTRSRMEVVKLRLTSSNDPWLKQTNRGGLLVLNPDGYRDWILGQPVSMDVWRESAIWKRSELEVVYFEDIFQSGQKRRRVVHASGKELYLLEAWRSFIKDARRANCSCVEIFTTDAAVDRIWGALGALRHADAPVLFLGTLDVRGQMLLHGWDRENWTYLAQSPCECHG